MVNVYNYESNKAIPYKDWRDPSLRKEGFFIWLKWRMRWHDLDHYMINNAYRDAEGVFSPTGEKMTDEQRLWFSFIFGMTYQSEMAWVIYWNFPNFWEIDLEELQKWNIKNLYRQRYAKDTKYNKGRITEQVSSMREIFGEYGSIRKFIDAHTVVGDEHKTFENLTNAISKIHKFGRMTTWLANQVLFETANVQNRPNTMLATDPSNWSVRSGLMYVYNKDEKIEAKTKEKITFTEKEKQEILDFEKELYEESFDYLDDESKNIFSYYLLESHLCQYKKLMLGGDYAGHSSGDHYSRFLLLSGLWSEVNFGAFLKAIENHHPLVKGKKENKELRDLCKHTGQMINMHMDFPDKFPDLYKEYNIDISKLNEDDYKKTLKNIILTNSTYEENRQFLPKNSCDISGW